MSASFKTSIKGKIIAIFLISLAALISFYFVNKFAFSEIRSSVEDLSYTNKKLIIINSVFFEVNESEKSFRNMLTTDSSFDEFILQSKSLKFYSDSLRKLCADNTYQVTLIDSINKLFQVRQKFLLGYVDFRRKLRNNNPVLKQAKTLDSLISIENSQVDSLVYSREHNKSITRIDTVMLPEDAEKKGFWRKIFKSKKKENSKVNKVVQREEKNTIDTIIQVKRNSISQEAQKVIDAIGTEQNLRRKKFLNKEIALNSFENSFHSQITALLSEIEKDITHQTGIIHFKAEKSIGKNIDRVLVIIAFFFLFSVIIVLLMLADITKSNKYRQLLEIARKDAELQSLSWQHFLSNMSHEIRTPLQSIIGYAEQMMEKEEESSGYIDIIHSSSEHLLQIINEILDYNRINSGKFTFEHTCFNIRQLITETISTLRLLADKKGLSFLSNEQEIPEDYFLEGDPFRLKQILMNLIGNAIKSTNQGSVVLRVSFRPDMDKDVFTFQIKDTGPGIPIEMQEVIFNRFEQIHLSLNQQYQGSGLGLSIVKTLVEGQEGNISLASELGKGSCFTFEIAYATVKAPAIVQNLPPTILMAPESKVWLVDDDNLILKLCSRIFEKYGITYCCFNSTESFLNMPLDQPPAIILVDIRMPHRNGFQLYDEIKKRFPPTLPVIAVTAQALPEERDVILRHGFNGLLLKPFREEELLFIISKKTGNVLSIEDNKTNTSNIVPLVSEETKEEANEILQYYIAETNVDIRCLQLAVATDNIEEATMMLHRLAGRTSQIGEKDLGQAIRKTEISIRHNLTLDKSAIVFIIDEITKFITTIKAV